MTLPRLLPRRFNYGEPCNRAAPLNRGLTLWLMTLPQHGNSRWMDISGNRRHGVWGGSYQELHGSNGFARPSGFYAWSLESDRYVDCGTIGLFSGRTKFALALWYQRHSGSNYGPLIGEYDGSDTANRNVLQVYNDGVTYFSMGTSNYFYFPWNDTNTHHLVCSYDGTQSTDPTRFRMYMDGVEQSLTFNAAVPAVAPTKSTPFLVGKGGTSFSYCYIDDVRVYDRDLSVGEVRSLYQASRSGYIRELNWLTDPLINSVAAAPGTGKSFYNSLQEQIVG